MVNSPQLAAERNLFFVFDTPQLAAGSIHLKTVKKTVTVSVKKSIC
jgi:hypothetical protein